MVLQHLRSGERGDNCCNPMNNFIYKFNLFVFFPHGNLIFAHEEPADFQVKFGESEFPTSLIQTE